MVDEAVSPLFDWDRGNRAHCRKHGVSIAEIEALLRGTPRIHPQRMICPNPLLKIYIAEKATTNPVVATHRHPRSPSQGTTMRKIGNPFSAAC
jgi:hypothetical protein